MIITILLIIFVAGIVIGILYSKGKFKSSDKNSQNLQTKNTPNKQYINPQPFETGYIQNTPQPLADMCNANMYPIQPPYVDYGPNNCSYNCDVNTFNSPP